MSKGNGVFMTNAMAETAKKSGQKSKTLALANEIPAQAAALDRCYGQIGISAVAAAARYQGAAKNPAYAPASAYWHDRAGDAAA